MRVLTNNNKIMVSCLHNRTGKAELIDKTTFDNEPIYKVTFDTPVNNGISVLKSCGMPVSCFEVVE